MKTKEEPPCTVKLQVLRIVFNALDKEKGNRAIVVLEQELGKQCKDRRDVKRGYRQI